ncbi:AMP-binding protein [Arundinibacter roseus]|uniref:Acyl-CoA synthetase n=1 Tax=Arundinibacter roseus TaxID=2070510 RepID=A0A4R4KG76_9BACT|nr:AMP-binding protein [Arundinibacter roseus]TDB67050.1 acyl-CoA synthetase [Arundinibacter roseus]
MKIWITTKNSILTEPPPEHPEFLVAYHFAQKWLNGAEEFSLKTSGSTGIPKIITIRRNQLAVSARMTATALDLPGGSRCLICLNVEYIAGLMMVVRSLVMDWEMTFVEPSSNPLLIPELSKPFDFLALVPLQLSAICGNETSRARLEACGKVLVGGAPVSQTLLTETRKLSVPVYQSYGMTETVSHVALRRLNAPVLEEDYTFLPEIDFGTDDRQCLFVRGEVTDFQLVQTNDLVEITSERTFKWIGRLDSIINSGGLKIQLDKIDQKMEECWPNDTPLLPFFSWFEPDDRLGQKLIVFVEGEKNSVIEKKILHTLSQKVKPFEVPKAFYFIHEIIKTPTGKLNKPATADLFFTK